MQQNIQVQPCSQDSIGDMVTPADSTALCNIMIAQPTMGNALQVRWDDLAVTSCALLNPSITYCY